MRKNRRGTRKGRSKAPSRTCKASGLATAPTTKGKEGTGGPPPPDDSAVAHADAEPPSPPPQDVEHSSDSDGDFVPTFYVSYCSSS